MMKYISQFAIFFLVLFAIALIYISGLAWLLSFIFSLLFYGTLIYLVVFLYKKLRKKETPEYKKVFLKFLRSAWISLFLVIGIIWGFAYYQNEIAPAQMPLYTLSNWEKTLLFQWMSHIGTERFYEEVRNNIRAAKNDDFVLYFEWVQEGSQENMEKFNKILWVEFDADLYKNFSKLYWLVHQDNDSLLWLVNDEDYNVDLWIDRILEIYEEKYPLDVIDEEKELLAVSSEITNILATLDPRQLSILIYINQAIINTIIKYDSLRESILDISGSSNIFDVILNDRNTYLVNEIITGPHEKIFTTYGLMHYSWVYEELKKQDSRWELIDTQYLYPIK